MKQLLIIITIIFNSTLTMSQDIILDQPVRAGALTLFPSISNKNEYYYLSDKPRMAKDANGRPQFSFLRYVDNVKSGADQPNLEEGEGGGIVHAVIELDVTKEQIEPAKQDRRRVNANGIIRGPALYQGGTIALISTVSDPESGFSKKVLGLGKAPILEGQKAAISILLTKLGAKVLWESFKTPTPDMSISFEMELKGYKSPKRAIIEANFDQMYSSQAFQAAVISRQGQTMLAGEIDIALEEQLKSGSIKVTQIGEDENMEKAIDDAYSKLTRMMFEPAAGAGINAQLPIPGQSQSTSLLDRAQSILDKGREAAIQDYQLLRDDARAESELFGDASGGNTPTPTPTPTTTPDATDPSLRRRRHISSTPPEGYTNRPAHYGQAPSAALPPPTIPTTAIVASYKLRQSRQQGIFRIDLNKYTLDNLTVRFDENFGQINCSQCFREVNIGDPLYKQREINTVLDGFNSEDFGKYINFVAVTMRKKHADGQYSTDEISIDKAKFNLQGNNFKLLYGWRNDVNRAKWGEYEYKVVWNYFGGFSNETEWKKSSLNTIGLAPPLYRKSVDIEADINKMNEANVRSAEVKIYYKIGTEEQVKTTRLNIRNNQATSQIELLQPSNELKYEYEVIWNMSDGSTQQSKRKASQSTYIYADNIK